MEIKKKKVKDVILIDSIQDQPKSVGQSTEKEKLTIDNDLKSEEKKELPIEDKKREELKNQKEIREKQIKVLMENKRLNKFINDVLFQVQLLFSYSQKINPKLVDFLLKYLTESNLKDILEERDSSNKCGNILCDNPNKNTGEDTYFYDYKHKRFLKNELKNLFCNVRCMQKFKDTNKICEKFDYLRLTKETTFLKFLLLKDYFPSIPQLTLISEITSRYLDSNKINYKNGEKLSKIREKLNKRFVDNFEEFFNFDDLQKKEITSISNIFEEGMKID